MVGHSTSHSVVYYLQQPPAALLEVGSQLGVLGAHHVEFLELSADLIGDARAAFAGLIVEFGWVRGEVQCS